VIAFLFPVFASYKALKANDQTQLTPWLMYWVVIGCFVAFENFFGWFLNLYIPSLVDLTVQATFISRDQGHVLAVAGPASDKGMTMPSARHLRQGATYLYLNYIHPYILAHEADIENLISSGHDQAVRLGITYLRRLWAYIQELLGVPPQVHPTIAYQANVLGTSATVDSSTSIASAKPVVRTAASSKVLVATDWTL
jgi:receptor expression-enhancing protein 1/2/3/4